MRNRNTRAMIFSAFIIILSLLNFSTLDGRENVSNVQMITLWVGGVASGIFLQNLLARILRAKE